LLLAAGAVAVGFAAQAQTVRTKANNADNLNLGSSWVGNTAPSANEVALWTNTVTGASSVLLGANLSYRGITIFNPGGTVALGGAHSLSTDMLGINMSRATAGLIITNANLTLKDYASPVWNVTNGMTLTVSPATFVRGSQATLGLPGAGTVESATLTNDAQGIIGPWARYGTGTSMKYATMVGGVITGYTGTAAATAADVTDITGALNYDVAAAGTLGAGASFNTLRYAGAAGTIAGDLTANGLLNASSTGVLTLSSNVTIGASKELVLTSPDNTRQITLAGVINDNGGGASGITVAGGGQVNLNGNSTYSGTTVIGTGVLRVNQPNALGSSAGNTLVYSTGRTTDGGQLQLYGGVTIAESVTLLGPGDGASASYTRALDAWSGTNTLSAMVTLTGTSSYRIGISGASGTVLNLGLIQRSTTGGNTLICDPAAGTVLSISAAIDNNGGGLTCHGGGGSGLTVLNASYNDLGGVTVQNDSSLKITAVDALATNSSLQIGRELGNAEKGANNDKGIFYLDAASQTVNALNGYSNNWPNASATIFRRVTSSTVGTKTLTVGNANGTGSFDGVIENGTGGGTISVVKAGTGTQTFTGTRDNTYTGLTAVNGGVLALNKSAGTNAVAGNIVIGSGTLSHSQNNQIADTATVAMTNATAKWLLNSKSETIANLDMQNAGAVLNSGFVTGVGGKLTVTGTLTHSLGDITLNSSGAGGSAWIDAYAVVNLGGAWTFGGNDGTQVLTVGAGGLTIGNGSMIDINAGATASNAVSLAGNVTSLAASAPNMITGKGEVKLNAERTVDVADGVAIVDLLLGAKITDGAGAGSLTKLGAGTLSLTNANTYTGGTAVNAGTLAIYSTLSLPGWNSGGAYTIASNATLAVGNGVADGAITTILGTGNFAAGGRLGFDTTLGDRTNSLALNDPSGVMLGLTKAGNNTLTLSGANGYTGHTAINEGTLAITGTGALPGWDTAGRYTVASGAMLLVPNAVTEANVVTMLATGNFANGAILGFDTTAGNRNHTAAIANSAGGVLNVYKTGINQLQLSGDSSYDGVTTIQKGVLRITHANALGSTNGATTIYSTGSNLTGGQLLVAGGLVVAEPISVIGPGDSGPLYHLAVQVPGAGGSNTLTGPVTINTPGAVRMGAGGTDSVLVFKGPFMRATAANALQVTVGADNGRVIFDTWIDNKGGDLALPGGGRGVVQFNVASNNIGNVQIAGKHELRLGASDALAVNRQVQIGYESPWADASIGTLNLAGYNQTINQLYGGGSSNAVTARVVTNSAPSLSTLTVGNGNGSGTFDGVIGGHLALTKVGTGTQTLGGPGTFTGDTTVQAGMLRITNALALQQSTLVTSTGAFSVASLTDCTLGGLSGSYALGLTNATGAALTLNVGNNNSDTTFSGALSGSGSLKKIGNGKLTLAGVNTYTGATTVEAGTLALGCDNALSTGTQITLNGGTLAPGSFANSLSALMVGASNGTIDVGDGSGALAFAGSSGQTWNGTLNITFTGEWNPYALKFGTSPAGLSAAQLSSLRVNGQKTWLILDAQGYLVRLTGTLIRVM
jgi:autotransporter-associated beta strand protein